MIEMVRDVLNWDMSDYEKIAMIEMIAMAVGPKPKTASEILRARYAPHKPHAPAKCRMSPKPVALPKKPIHKGPVAGTYRRGILWAKCLKADRAAAYSLGYKHATNEKMEKLLAKARKA